MKRSRITGKQWSVPGLLARRLPVLGRALLDSGKTADAIEPLERRDLAPGDPLHPSAQGTAYQRSGRKADAAREFALQKTAAAAINENVKTSARPFRAWPPPVNR